MRWQERAMQLCKADSANYIINFGSNYSYIKQTMPKEVYFPAVKMRFEDKEFQVPADTEYYLKRIYGPNYMELPPVEKRITHNIIRLMLGGSENE
jgi:lipopolysaccharide cholinephosphotransferase